MASSGCMPLGGTHGSGGLPPAAKGSSTSPPWTASSGGLPPAAEGSSSSPSLTASSGGLPPAVGFKSIPSGNWADDFKQVVQPWRASLGQQQRPLVVHSGFTGLGTHALACHATGVHIMDEVGAEPKVAAKTFLKHNALMAEHHFDDIRLVTSLHGGMCAQCMKECPAPGTRADLFMAGFSCQPFSPQRGKSLQTLPPSSHPLFESSRLVVEHLLAREPRGAILENTTGILSENTYDGERQSAMEWLRGQVSSKYFMSWTHLNLRYWSSMDRPKCWMFLVHKDTGSQEIADLAVHMAAEIEATRQRLGPPEPLSAFLWPAGTMEWREHVLSGLAGGRPHASSGGMPPASSGGLPPASSGGLPLPAAAACPLLSGRSSAPACGSNGPPEASQAMPATHCSARRCGGSRASHASARSWRSTCSTHASLQASPPWILQPSRQLNKTWCAMSLRTQHGRCGGAAAAACRPSAPA